MTHPNFTDVVVKDFAVLEDKTATASNVVDVVIRSLRKKLGPQARVLETVRGTGYRYRDSAPKGRVGSKLTV